MKNNVGIPLDQILPRVSRPARYTGGEWNQIVKDHRDVAVTFAFAFPDVYEVGMSHLGLKIVYHLLNRRDDVACERVFAPWVDMETLMRERGVPLFSLETRTPVSTFDIVGFTLQYEMTYTNIVNMLDLAGIPPVAAARGPEWPLVIAGGPCALNPEPVAEMFDCILIGDAEGALDEIIAVYKDWKQVGRRPGDRALAGASAAGDRAGPGAPGVTRDKPDLLRRLAGIEGCYVPSLYRPEYNDDGTVHRVAPAAGAPERVRRRIAESLDLTDYPLMPPVPYLDAVHDRAVVEVMRGCTRGCRFCQAGMIYRPVRERSPADVGKAAAETIRNTGYDELSLMSLSSTDYSHIRHVVDELGRDLAPLGVGLSLPSLRVDAFSVDIANKVQAVRKSGLTFAPEAGTQRLRDVINKRVTVDDLVEAASAAFESGWDGLKLYFMIGLPTETDADLEGIVDMTRSVAALYERVASRRSSGSHRRLTLTVSASSFVPKAHTPFQWEPQVDREELERRQRFLKDRLRKTRARFDWHDAGMSVMEAVLARGDRRLARVIIEAWRRGARFDSWTDRFREDLWLDALSHCGLNPRFYANRQRDPDELFPWDHVDSRIAKGFLLRERARAFKAMTTPDCRRDGCEACGVCV